MSSDIKKEVIKKTQDMLGKHIKAPPLSEKLLTKPPFRYLHDIVTNIIKETGYLEGVFSEQELKSENVKDKDAKITFLQKLIVEVKSTTKSKLSVRPSKVIAGLEPTETNLLLQAIAEGAEKKLSPKTEPVKKTTSKAIAKASPREKKEDAIKKKTVKPSTSTGNINKKGDSVKISPKVKSTKSVPITAKKSKTEKIDAPKPPTLIDNKNTVLLDSDVGVSKLDDINNGEDKSVTLEEIKEVNVIINEKIEEANASVEEFPKEFNENKHLNEKIDSSKKSEYPIKQEEEITKHFENSEEQKEENINGVSTKARPPTATKVSSTEKPPTTLRPPSVRPMSARPGAPKIRDKQDIELPVEEIVTMGQVQVIVEDVNIKDTDEEETVVIKAIPEPAPPPPSTLHSDIPNEQGHLVSQILQQLDDDIEVSKPKEEIIMKPGEISKELEQLRNSIQTLTKAANPLGKLMNYLQEDVEAMYDELVLWKNINVQIRRDILKHKQDCENAMKPIKIQLQELEENIQKQQEEIFLVRSNIFNNKQVIERLLVPIN